ncbi:MULTISPECIES: hypothetical protein [Chryseobacterium group]|uniref:Uncharacterized protein n=2 Tax=Chryseobacterium TaxID=59732 RepID=A0AAJ1R558_9FLAO|nr:MULTISPECIES: hypothetical protein [Chryseobacterium group]EFK33159.1 hypothetical protein HMPREF0204_12227 [Chryseobacterium gleum ATCC 35910]MDN4013255.1 hypothetical protein [Chryseobacterium gambrini]QQY33974.1 hypothetical protein I6I60_09510 [Chryseobacterium gleum]QWA40166.1 hypothetical protein KKI44_08155 [Chryseobacterium sp. ZHDP1]
MQQNIIKGKIVIPEEKKQKQVHQQVGDFMKWMKQEKDSSEVQKDQRKSVPLAQIPMVF